MSKNLDAKLELVDAAKDLTDVSWYDDPDLTAEAATVALLFDVRWLLVEVVNELRTLRACGAGLAWPEVQADKKGGASE